MDDEGEAQGFPTQVTQVDLAFEAWWRSDKGQAWRARMTYKLGFDVDQVKDLAQELWDATKPNWNVG
jgi:hypothetical protein